MRRSARLLLGASALAAALAPPAPAAAERISPMAMTPLISTNYQPQGADERGFWDRMERVEEDLATSDLIVRDPALNAYVRGVAERVMGSRAANLRVYIVRSTSFNALTLPNGLMLINSGLLLRMRSEAELAGVLAHEIGHYLRLHQIRKWRDLKRRSGISAFISVGLAIGGAAAGVGTYDLISAINNAMFFGALSYSRELESEADAMGLRLIAEAHYRPLSMSETWMSFVAEEEASARARNRRRDRGFSMLATHPAPEQRMLDLRASAAEVERADATDVGEDRFQAALRPLLPDFLRDQIMLNDPGASLFVVNRLAAGNWTGLLRFHEGEIYRMRGLDGDGARADAAYAAAVALPDAPPEAWRAHGYALIRRGETETGRAALAHYLEMRPGAPDAAMVRHSMTN